MEFKFFEGLDNQNHSGGLHYGYHYFVMSVKICHITSPTNCCDITGISIKIFKLGRLYSFGVLKV